MNLSALTGLLIVALAFQVQGSDLLNLTTAVQTVTGEVRQNLCASIQIHLLTGTLCYIATNKRWSVRIDSCAMENREGNLKTCAGYLLTEAHSRAMRCTIPIHKAHFSSYGGRWCAQRQLSESTHHLSQYSFEWGQPKSVYPEEFSVNTPFAFTDGTFSGTSEAVFILGFLQNKLQAPAETNPCQQFYTGTLLGQSVVVAISGNVAADSFIASVVGCLQVKKSLLLLQRPQNIGWFCRYWS